MSAATVWSKKRVSSCAPVSSFTSPRTRWSRLTGSEVSTPPRMSTSVEPTSAACVLESVAAGAVSTLDHEQDSIMAGLNCATPSLVAWPIVSQGIDVYLAVPDARVPEAMQLLARDGIVAGETGATGLAGMLALLAEPSLAPAQDELRLGPDTSVLLLCTEGATDPDAYRRLVGDAGLGS